MAKKISQLDPAAPLTGDELMMVSQGSPTLASKRTTVGAIRGTPRITVRKDAAVIGTAHTVVLTGAATVTQTSDGIIQIAIPQQASDFSGFYPGKPGAGAIVMRVPIGRAFTFPSGMAASVGSSANAATAQADFDLKKNGVSFGTMRFAASDSTATFIAASATSFAAGDLLEIVAPAVQDGTLGNVGFYLKGDR